jgi:hypothetical protein
MRSITRAACAMLLLGSFAASGCATLFTASALPKGEVRRVQQPPERLVGSRWVGETLETLVQYEDGQRYVLSFAIGEGGLVPVAPARPEHEAPEPASGSEALPFGELPAGESIELRTNPARTIVYRTGARELWADLPAVVSTRPPSPLYGVGYLALVPAVALDVALTPLYAVLLIVALFAMH